MQMITSTVLVCLLLVSSAASQEGVNVHVLQSDSSEARCPPADQLGEVRNNITETIYSRGDQEHCTTTWIIPKSSNLMCEPTSKQSIW